MAMNREIVPPIDETATAAYAHLFQALAEPTRLAIVQHLSSGEHRVRDLVAHMGLAQSTVSKHISFLLECGLVTVRPEGRASWYALAEPALLRILIAAAERMLEATGNPAVLCSHLRPGGMADSERSA
ncbi:MAG: metalloregulator ArsR/SmtB family transcription factor [Actinomycetaceae bacterium]|nr:metalloregulator ArsR/SmtB family transcription factor [Actinomycetaceae bacterium]